jgi:hypothetical protein
MAFFRGGNPDPAPVFIDDIAIIAEEPAGN